MSSAPETIEMLHDGQVIARWTRRGSALDGSGDVYLTEHFSHTAISVRASVSEVDVMDAACIRQLLDLPGVRVL